MVLKYFQMLFVAEGDQVVPSEFPAEDYPDQPDMDYPEIDYPEMAYEQDEEELAEGKAGL